MSELPDSWARVPLDMVGSWGSGGTPTRTNDQYYAKEGIPWLVIGDLNDKVVFKSSNFITELGLANSSAKLLPAGTLLVAMYGSIGKLGITGIECATNQAIAFCKPNESIVSLQYLYHALFNAKPDLLALGQGGAQQNISQSVLKEFEIPLAPKNEQTRISNQLDTLLTRIQSCNDRFDAIPAMLKRFRQTVMDAATTGVLTGEWREKNYLDDATALNELIKIERSKRGSLKVRGSSANVESELLFDIPPSWAWVANHRLAQDDGNAICAGPFGTIFKAKDFRPSGVPIIFLRHVGNSRFLIHKPGFMDEQIWAEFHQPYSVFGGELLVTKLGDPPGTACIYPAENGKAMVTPDVMKMSVNAEAAEARYLMYFFNSPNAKKIVEALCFGVTRLRIDLSMFKTFPIPLPSRKEQAEIVRRVEALFALADRIDARCTAARSKAQRLTPLVLAKAFRGELVPQDPNDEPGSALLARIGLTKTTVAGKNKRKAPVDQLEISQAAIYL